MLKSLRTAVAIAAAAVLLVGCGGPAGTGSTGTTPAPTGMVGGAKEANTAEVKAGGTVTYSVTSDPKNWNILSGTGDVFGYRQIMNMVMPSVMISQPDFTMAPNTALIESAKVVTDSPQTIEYKIRKEAVWNDGTPITSADFEYLWKAMDATQCPTCVAATTTGYDKIKSITGSDNGKTVTVEMKSTYQPWSLLFPYLLPSHIAAQNGAVADSFNGYFQKTVPTWSGGPFVIKSYSAGKSVTLERNPKWYGDKVNLDTIVVLIITDERQAVTAMANGEVNILAPTPTLDLVTQMKQIPNVTVQMASGLLYEHLDFNVKSGALADVQLRKALFTAVSTQAIIDKTVGQFSPQTKPLGNRSFMPGQTLDGVPAYKDTATPLGLGTGNVEAAKKVLTDAGYKIEGGQLKDKAGANVGPFRLVHSKGNQVRRDSSILVQSALKEVGVTITIVETDNLGKSVTESDFDLIIYGTNLDVIPTRTTASVFATSKPHTQYVDKEMNGWLDQAVTTLDAKQVVDLLNKVDQRLSEQAITLPLYQTPTVLAFRSDIGNVRVNPTRFGTTYNTQAWGIKK